MKDFICKFLIRLFYGNSYCLFYFDKTDHLFAKYDKPHDVIDMVLLLSSVNTQKVSLLNSLIVKHEKDKNVLNRVSSILSNDLQPSGSSAQNQSPLRHSGDTYGRPQSNQMGII